MVGGGNQYHRIKMRAKRTWFLEMAGWTTPNVKFSGRARLLRWLRQRATSPPPSHPTPSQPCSGLTMRKLFGRDQGSASEAADRERLE